MGRQRDDNPAGRAAELYAGGCTEAEIAAEMGRDIRTFRNWLKGQPKRRSGPRVRFTVEADALILHRRSAWPPVSFEDIAAEVRAVMQDDGARVSRTGVRLRYYALTGRPRPDRPPRPGSQAPARGVPDCEQPSRSRYGRGCRCGGCTEAHRSGAAATRKAARDRAEASPDGITHGTLWSYSTLGCRCDSCRAVRSARPRGTRKAAIDQAREARDAGRPLTDRQAAALAAAAKAAERPLTCGRPSASRYAAGCRCAACAEANRARVADLTSRPPGDVPHGTASGYGNWGCRCDECKPAGARQNLLAQARRKQRFGKPLSAREAEALAAE